MKKKSVLGILLVLVLSIPAYGLVYTWTDVAGLAHFTNKEYEIPDRYRARAKVLYPEPSDNAAFPQSAQLQPETSAIQPAQQAKPEEPASKNETFIIPVPHRSPAESTWKYRKRRFRGTTSE